MDYPKSWSVVLDNGSGTIKAGYSGEDTPITSFSPRQIQNVNKRNNITIADAEEQFNPIQRGQIKDWDAMENLWTYILEQDLRTNFSNQPLIMSESPLTPIGEREKLASILFETHKVPGLYFANTSVLSLFATGRTRGIVIESGAGVSSSVPVFEGFALPHAIKRVNFAGNDVTNLLSDILSKEANKNLTFETCTHIKETVCGLNKTPLHDTKRNNSTVGQAYELPDGQTIMLKDSTLHSVPESLFDNNGKKGLSTITIETLEECDRDLFPDLLNSVVLAGGTSMFTGFASRVEQDLRRYVASKPATQGQNVQVIPDSQRKCAAWIGGSILASLGTFDNMLVSRQQYEENGMITVRGMCL